LGNYWVVGLRLPDNEQWHGYAIVGKYLKLCAVCVLRGGAFNNNHSNVRCAVRINNEPDNRNNNIGFRVVLSTLTTRNDQSLPASAPRLMAGYFPGRASFGRANSNGPFPCLSG
jgi:Sulfatase-modifying factor enzyme 1